MTTKIWPASAREIRACLADSSRVDHGFWRCGEHYAMIHDGVSRRLQAQLRALAGPDTGLVVLPGDGDPSFAMWPGAVRKMLLARGLGVPLRAVLEFPSTCVNKIEIADIARRAALTLRGLVFCVYEDW